jgi:hypothetical protein
VWQCAPNMNPTTPFTTTTNGSIYCMSQDGISCMWRSPAECEALTINPIANPSTSIPTCAQNSSQLYNGTHWCFWASQALLPPPAMCKQAFTVCACALRPGAAQDLAMEPPSVESSTNHLLLQAP